MKRKRKRERIRNRERDTKIRKYITFRGLQIKLSIKDMIVKVAGDKCGK